MDERYADLCRRSLGESRPEVSRRPAAGRTSTRTKSTADWDALYSEIADSLDDARPKDDRTQALIENHFKIASRFYSPTREAYIGMAMLYSEDAGMKDSTTLTPRHGGVPGTRHACVRQPAALQRLCLGATPLSMARYWRAHGLGSNRSVTSAPSRF
jgi:hypothetical protein